MDIHPVFDKMLSRGDKETLLGQNAIMIWFTGLSGSGKSTLSIALERELFDRGFVCRLLDGDNIRSGINKNLTFSPEDRIENIRRIAEVSKLFVDSGIITLGAFISPTEDVRDLAKSIIGEENFIEVFVSTPISVCESRDVKGLYKKAHRGELKEFTGVSSPFEEPLNPTISLDTSKLDIKDSVEQLLQLVLPRIEKKDKI